MPRATKPISPATTHRLVCDSDENESPQPAFIYKSLDGDEWMQVIECEELTPENITEIGQRKTTNRIYAAIAVGLVGWENMFDPVTREPIPFDVANIRRVINPLEAMQDLLPKLLMTCQVTTEDQQNFESPPVSAPA